MLIVAVTLILIAKDCHFLKQLFIRSIIVVFRRNQINIYSMIVTGKNLYRLCFCIYGFNLTIIAHLYTLLIRRLLGRDKGAAAAASRIIFYTLLVGANAVMVQAACARNQAALQGFYPLKLM